ncbi:MAG TPA: hypothetical protein O0X23_00220 [Methanocorpusculum sp.]|nr:hypothetical protein [Methanocorpusculum sp.]
MFADTVTDRAAAIILTHNHPSENLTPKRTRHSGNILGIELLDYLIIGLWEGFRGILAKIKGKIDNGEASGSPYEQQ